METQYQDEECYYQAKKRVEEIKGFYANLTSYIVVNIGLMTLNLATLPEYLWFFWPLLGWGIGVFFHGMKVFNRMSFLSKSWEQQKIMELMEKEECENKKWK